MKKRHLLSAFLMLFSLTAMAQNSISVNEVLVPQGRQAMMEVMFHFNEGHDYVSYQFEVNLPDGLSFVADTDGQVLVELGDGQPTSRFSKEMPTSSAIMKAYSNPSTVIAANEGVLVRIPVMANQSLAAGTTLTGTIKDIVFTHITDEADNSFGNASFTIKITDKITLDENYTWVPFATDAATGLHVKRTFKANEWSTFCFPFPISLANLKTAIGDNECQIAVFDGYEVGKDGDEVVSLKLKFHLFTGTGVPANTPYLIKTSRDVTDFDVTAKLTPNDNPFTNITIYDEQSFANVEIARMQATYRAGTVVPKNSLFLSGNKFYYSAGLTKMKAFRAYFTLNDVLSDAAKAGTRVTLNIGGEDTVVNTVEADTHQAGPYYDLQGRRVENPAKKGLYIRNGKKEIVK